jgi:hypothetical protein
MAPIPGFPWKFTEEELAVIKRAILTGASSVQVGDERITFRDWPQLVDIIMAGVQPVRSTRAVTFTVDKGL